MVTLFLPLQQLAPTDVAALIRADVEATRPLTAVYFADSGRLQLYRRQFTDAQLGNASQRGRPDRTIVVAERPPFDDLRDALQFLDRGIFVWNGSGPNRCELCSQADQHHHYCPLSFRRHRASYIRNLAEFLAGVDKGYMGQVTMASPAVRSSFGLGVLCGQMQRTADGLAVTAPAQPSSQDHG